MAQKNKAGFGLSGLSVLLLLFFALPWLTLSCSGRELIEQNGYQVIIGSASSVEEKGGKKPDEKIEKEKEKESIAAWWLLLVPLGALAAGFAGFRVAQGNPGAARLAVPASGAAAIVMTMTLLLGFPLEHKVEKMKGDMAADAKKSDEKNPFKGLGEALSNALDVKRHNAVWLTTGTTWAMVGLSLYLFSRDKTKAS